MLLIMVMGLPGSGKSYFASKLSAQLKAVHLENDVIRKELHKMGSYSKEDKMEVYRELCRRTEALVLEEKSVVVDATFQLKEYRELIYQLSSRYEVPLSTILVEANESLVKKRLKKPRKTSEANYEVYLKLKKDFDPVRPPFLSVTSGESNLDKMLQQAMDYINPDQ
ncbi:ATP-binding protein [Algoriphagus lutimaris]|uniref:AAA family ATPase n=1 Tax=Algoriphagus lutimaris TaxID=613197 RepID=UPI00196B8928|nr:ATP-binding protein [Algoriphagus lutimaris]MBN3520412.1 ATP-binding protein [Algoriphagus lutimaris]